MIDQSRFRLKNDVLMAVAPSMPEMLRWALAQGFEQFSVHTDPKTGEVRIGAPLNQEQRDGYKWLYHRMKGLDKPDPPKSV